jgi:phosphohistidine phosphatase
MAAPTPGCSDPGFAPLEPLGVRDRGKDYRVSERRLLLMRHAKSSWSDPSLQDRDRPLAERGVRAVAAMADHLAGAGYDVGLVLCSAAQRAVETLDGITGGLRGDAHVSVEEDLYGATADDLLRRLRKVSDDPAVVLTIGHNPGIEDLAMGLIGSDDLDLRARLEAKYPTAALATLVFDAPWSELDWGAARLEAFVTPRDLT